MIHWTRRNAAFLAVTMLVVALAAIGGAIHWSALVAQAAQ
jgi:hypothetical protein